MKNLAPDIMRQRLLIEGFYSKKVTKDFLREYLYGVAKHLNLKTYDEPTIFSPGSLGKEENAGFDAFIPLIDSRISAYVWSKNQFLSIIIYTYKAFNEQEAILYTKKYFEIAEIESFSF